MPGVKKMKLMYSRISNSSWGLLFLFGITIFTWLLKIFFIIGSIIDGAFEWQKKPFNTDTIIVIRPYVIG